MKAVIPPVLVVLCLAGMAAVHLSASAEQVIEYPYNLAGVLLIAAGIAMGVASGKLFRKVDTQIHTFKEPQKLVTAGLFRFSRNPIYLGFTFILLGSAVCFGTAISLLFPALFWMAANFWYIPFEERKMQRVFGQAYFDYQSKVRRWI